MTGGLVCYAGVNHKGESRTMATAAQFQQAIQATPFAGLVLATTSGAKHLVTTASNATLAGDGRDLALTCPDGTRHIDLNCVEYIQALGMEHPN